MELDQDIGPPNQQLYPAIVACLGEGRDPTLAEIAHVAKRIRREAFPAIVLSSACRHGIVLSALAALGAVNTAEVRSPVGR